MPGKGRSHLHSGAQPSAGAREDGPQELVGPLDVILVRYRSAEHYEEGRAGRLDLGAAQEAPEVLRGTQDVGHEAGEEPLALLGIRGEEDADH